MLAQQVSDHGQHQRRRQRQAHRDGHEASPGRNVFFHHGSIGGAGLITGITHGTAQSRVQIVARCHHDACRFGGQIHRGLLHARHFLEGFFDAAHTRRTGHAANTDVNRGRR